MKKSSFSYCTVYWHTVHNICIIEYRSLILASGCSHTYFALVDFLLLLRSALSLPGWGCGQPPTCLCFSGLRPLLSAFRGLGAELGPGPATLTLLLLLVHDVLGPETGRKVGLICYLLTEEYNKFRAEASLIILKNYNHR